MAVKADAGHDACQRRLYETEWSRRLQVIRRTATNPTDTRLSLTMTSAVQQRLRIPLHAL